MPRVALGLAIILLISALAYIVGLRQEVTSLVVQLDACRGESADLSAQNSALIDEAANLRAEIEYLEGRVTKLGRIYNIRILTVLEPVQLDSESDIAAGSVNAGVPLVLRGRGNQVFRFYNADFSATVESMQGKIARVAFVFDPEDSNTLSGEPVSKLAEIESLEVKFAPVLTTLGIRIGVDTMMSVEVLVNEITVAKLSGLKAHHQEMLSSSLVYKVGSNFKGVSKAYEVNMSKNALAQSPSR